MNGEPFPASGTAPEVPEFTIPEHQRRNHDATDTAWIRLEGLAYALQLVADNLDPETPRSDRLWAAFYALQNQVGDLAATVRHLRRLEWAGLGGNTPGLTEVEIATARGEA